MTPVQHITFIRLTHSGLSLGQCILVPRKSEDFADKSSSVSQDQIGYLQVMKETEAAWLDGLLFSAHIIGVPVYEWHSKINVVAKLCVLYLT